MGPFSISATMKFNVHHLCSYVSGSYVSARPRRCSYVSAFSRKIFQLIRLHTEQLCFRPKYFLPLIFFYWKFLVLFSFFVQAIKNAKVIICVTEGPQSKGHLFRFSKVPKDGPYFGVALTLRKRIFCLVVS